MEKTKAKLIYESIADPSESVRTDKQHTKAWTALVEAIDGVSDKVFDSIVYDVCEAGKGSKLDEREDRMLQNALGDCHH